MDLGHLLSKNCEELYVSGYEVFGISSSLELLVRNLWLIYTKKKNKHTFSSLTCLSIMKKLTINLKSFVTKRTGLYLEDRTGFHQCILLPSFKAAAHSG